MTREEFAALREQRAKDKAEAAARHLAQVQAQNREAERKRRNQRRFQVGTLADNAGLFAWDNVTLAGLFGVLARFEDCPDPVAVLDGLLGCVSPRETPVERDLEPTLMDKNGVEVLT